MKTIHEQPLLPLQGETAAPSAIEDLRRIAESLRTVEPEMHRAREILARITMDRARAIAWELLPHNPERKEGTEK